MFGEIGKSNCLSMQGGDVPAMTMIQLFPAKEYARWLTRAPKDPTLRPRAMADRGGTHLRASGGAFILDRVPGRKRFYRSLSRHRLGEFLR